MRLRAWMTGFLRPQAEGTGLVAEAPTVAVRPMLRRIGPHLRPYRAAIVVLVLLTAALVGIETVEIWLFQSIVDDVLVPMTLQPLWGIAALYLVLSLTSGLLGWLETYLSTWVGERMTFSVRRDMLERIQQAPTDAVDRTRSGDVLTRLTHDANSVEALLLGAAVDGVGTVARLVFFTSALLLLDWQLALVSFVVAPLFWWITRSFTQRLKRVSKERRRRAGSMASVAEESIATLALVQVHGRAREEQVRFDREGNAIIAASLSAARLRATYPILIDFLELLGMLTIVGLGTWALTDQRLTLGGLLVFFTYLTQLYKPVRDLGELGMTLASAAAGVERVIEVLDLPDGLPERPDAVPLAAVYGQVTVEAVGFTYRGASRAALSDVSFSVRPGRLTALAGPSGAGKSTAVRVVARLADPDHGRVLLDDVDVRDLPLRQVRDSLVVLLQEAPVLDASVRDNITFASPEADDETVWRALRMAGIDEVVAALPDGLDSPLGRSGRSLSGGQRQRIALARALVTDARVLVLDEPTTGLDDVSTRRLLQTLSALAVDRSVLVATHDPLVLAHADEVVTILDPAAVEVAE